MGSDFGRAVEQANGGGRSHQGQSAAQGWRRHGIIVEVEADAEGFIGVDGARRVTGERVSGERQQVRFLFGENLGHGAGVVAGPRALMGDLVAPVERLAVEILQGGEGTGGEEAGPNVLDGALHAAFFIAAGRAARTSGEVIVGGEFQEAGVESEWHRRGAPRPRCGDCRFARFGALHPSRERHGRGRGENSPGSGRERTPATRHGCRRG